MAKNRTRAAAVPATEFEKDGRPMRRITGTEIVYPASGGESLLLLSVEPQSNEQVRRAINLATAKKLIDAIRRLNDGDETALHERFETEVVEVV